MKIAFIFSQFPSGQISNITRVVSAIKLGHEVVIFARSKEKNYLSKELSDYFLKAEIIYFDQKIHDILKLIFFDLLTSPINTIKRLLLIILNKYFYQFHVKREDGARNKKRIDIKIKKRLQLFTGYVVLKEFENRWFDVFITFFGPVGTKYIFLKNIFPKSLYVNYFVGYDFSYSIYPVGSSELYTELFLRADMICVKSEFSKETLNALGCPREKLFIDYNGIDTNVFKPSNKSLTPTSEVRFVMVSRLVQKKNHIMLLRVFNKILKNRNDFNLKIVGDGEMYDNIVDFLKLNKRLSDKVVVTGSKSQREINVILNDSDVYIQPSTISYLDGNMEDTPTSIIEAMAVGLPIITTYHAGIPDLVINEYNGKVVPERYPSYLENAILDLLDNKDKLENMSRNSLKLFDDKFRTSINSKILLDEFEKKIESIR